MTTFFPLSTMSNFQLICDALDNYAKQMKINLHDNPFAEEVKCCDSPEAVLQLLERNRNEFKEYREKNRKFIDCLNPVVQFVHIFSGILGEAASLVSPALSLCFPYLYFSTSFRSTLQKSSSSASMSSFPYCFPPLSASCAPLISSHIRRLKESAQVMMHSLNSLSASETFSNASKFIPRSL